MIQILSKTIKGIIDYANFDREQKEADHSGALLEIETAELTE